MLVNWQSLTCVAAAVTMFFAAGSFSFAAAPSSGGGGVKPGDVAPGFLLEDQNGKKVSLADFAGKIVVLEWFNPECPFVQKQYPPKSNVMNDTASKYKDKDVIWLAINSSKHENTQTNKDAAKNWGILTPVLNDSKGDTGRAYGARTTPHMFVIGKDGKIAYVGAIDNNKNGEEKNPVNYVAKALDEILAGKEVNTPQTVPYGCSVKY